MQCDSTAFIPDPVDDHGDGDGGAVVFYSTEWQNDRARWTVFLISKKRTNSNFKNTYKILIKFII